jgi:hypothetical protein
LGSGILDRGGRGRAKVDGNEECRDGGVQRPYLLQYWCDLAPGSGKEADSSGDADAREMADSTPRLLVLLPSNHDYIMILG